jgi:hypothetical protein
VYERGRLGVEEPVPLVVSNVLYWEASAVAGDRGGPALVGTRISRATSFDSGAPSSADPPRVSQHLPVDGVPHLAPPQHHHT